MASTYREESARIRRNYKKSVKRKRPFHHTPPPPYYWLNLQDGTWLIGTRGTWHRVSWAVMYADGTHGCVNDDEVVAKIPITWKVPQDAANSQSERDPERRSQSRRSTGYD